MPRNTRVVNIAGQLERKNGLSPIVGRAMSRSRLYHYIVASRRVRKCLHAKYTDTIDGSSGVGGLSTRVEVTVKSALALAIKVAKQHFTSQRGSVSMVLQQDRCSVRSRWRFPRVLVCCMGLGCPQRRQEHVVIVPLRQVCED
jgi:hypothetical protein